MSVGEQLSGPRRRLSLLWLSQISGTATSSHLGTGPYYAELCMFGILTAPGSPPPANGIPMNWYVQTQIWTAANGDRLMATGELAGLTTPPDDPNPKFIENLRFLGGGTGRFEFVEGEGLESSTRPGPSCTTAGFGTAGATSSGRIAAPQGSSPRRSLSRSACRDAFDGPSR